MFCKQIQSPKLTCLVVIGLLGFAPFAVGDDESSKEKSEGKQTISFEQLAGTYTIVRGEMEGKKLKGSELKTKKVVFEGNKVRTLDKSDGELYVAELQMQPHEKGAYVVMKSIKPPMPGIAAVGLISMKEDQVKLIYAFPDANAPEKFSTQEGQHMFVMKRQSSEPKPLMPEVSVPAN